MLKKIYYRQGIEHISNLTEVRPTQFRSAIAFLLDQNVFSELTIYV